MNGVYTKELDLDRIDCVKLQFNYIQHIVTDLQQGTHTNFLFLLPKALVN